jgi:hypothetical protein
MNLVHRFLFDNPAPQQVEIKALPVDHELQQRNAERARAAIARMGTRWALHPANAPLAAQPRRRAPDTPQEGEQ